MPWYRFGGAYRPLWLGLGAAAFDLLLAIAITSGLRQRLGYGAWRAVHWLSYAVWPLAVVHGLGTGSDVAQGWMFVVYAACGASVLIAIMIRAAIGWPQRAGWRVAAVGTTAGFAVGVAIWLPAVPLGRHWARRAGTPPSLLRPGSTKVGHA